MTLHALVRGAEWVFIAYFIALHGCYLGLLVAAVLRLRAHLADRTLDRLPRVRTGFERPVTIVVPAFNEEANIAASVRSLLQLDYGQFEIVVVNDGSKDGTLDTLIREFDLAPFPEAYRDRLATKRLRGVYRSAALPNLRVLDKENGGKADALNAGINAARYPLFCALDADSILERDSLERVLQPFLDDPTVIAAGGTVRPANGCQVRGGFLVRAGVPRNLLALLQIVEYMRAFLFARLGWAPVNGMLIISGAFGVFHKETVVAAGGYRTDTIGEDMELVVRLHRFRSGAGVRYRIASVPDAVCWTEVPEDRRVLRNQRIRWQRGLGQSIGLNSGLLFRRGSGVAGWLALPFAIVFEWLGPALEVAGYAVAGTALILGMTSVKFAAVFFAASIGLCAVMSAVTVLVEDLAFHVYPRVTDLAILLLVALGEGLAYRPLTALWRLRGLVEGLLRRRARWEVTPRRALLHSAD
jgi:cellulose synthase/poly-beta-1,6-N-acetylglucosamine synthase-like glycosyltransferase